MRTSVSHDIGTAGYPDGTSPVPRTGSKGGLIAVVGIGTVAWLLTNGSVTGPFASAVVVGGLPVIWLQRHRFPGLVDIVTDPVPDWHLGREDRPAIPGLRAAERGNGGGTGDSRDDDVENSDDGEESEDAEEAEGSQVGGNASGPAVPQRSQGEAWLSAAGVIEPCEDANDLCLNDQFRTGWYERIKSIRDDETLRTELAEEFDCSPGDIEFEAQDQAYIARTDDRPVGHWRSRAAMVADVAVTRELPEWFDTWDDLSTGLRGKLLFTARIFLDSCPLCDDSVGIAEETVEREGETHEVFAGRCHGCDAVLFEMPLPDAA